VGSVAADAGKPGNAAAAPAAIEVFRKSRLDVDIFRSRSGFIATPIAKKT
jgi:hypothetical protein